jgi:opacity protein-like surface antigen
MRRIKTFLSLAGLAAALFATSASAQFYIGAGLGSAKANDQTASGTVSGVPFTGSGDDQRKTSVQLNAGYQFTPMWGIEGQYTDLGKRGGQITFGAPVNGAAPLSEAKAHQWGVAGTLTYPLVNDFFVRGLLGVSSNHVNSSSATLGGVTYTSNSSSHTDVLAGIGAGYNFNKNISARIEYEYFGKFGTTSNGGSGNSGHGDDIGLRLQYMF